MSVKVSILIPCYNAEQWIAQAIESALGQTYPNLDVIVIDDGSSDRSLEVIKGFGDRIRWETQPNRGGNVTRNRLLALSTGEWLQYLDADDYLLPTKIEHQVDCLKHHPEADLVYSPSLFEYWEPSRTRQEVLPIPEPHDPWILLARWYLPQTGSPLWRKQAILDVGGWKPDQPCCQEHELYLRLLIAQKLFIFCSHAESVYRQWSESTVCKRNRAQTFTQRLQIEDQIEQHLRTCGTLTSTRQDAINQARFEVARLIWLSNRRWAYDVMTKIRANQAQFVPSGCAAPANYQFIYRCFGFAVAEYLAQFKRTLKHGLIASYGQAHCF